MSWHRSDLYTEDRETTLWGTVGVKYAVIGDKRGMKEWRSECLMKIHPFYIQPLKLIQLIGEGDENDDDVGSVDSDDDDERCLNYKKMLNLTTQMNERIVYRPMESNVN